MGADRSYATRIGRYGTVSTALALLSDRRLGALVDGAALIGTGIGGTAVRVDVEGIPVFAKRIALTDLERRPENVRSTANLFGLPTCCQYGVGSPGFGAWRELAANVMTTNWVLDRRSGNFPLLYHWRVLPGSAAAPSTPEELATAVEFWHGSPAIRERLDAVARSSASVVLFLEYLPQNLHDWLIGQLALGADAVGSACAMVERGLRTDVAVMNSGGLLHFDAHFRNILTDGERLYFADLGLATSARFELSTAELGFLHTNLSHDACYAVTQLVNWLVTAFRPGATDPAPRNEFIRQCATGGEPVGVPPAAAAIIARYAPIAVVLNDFYWTLFGETRTVGYPAEQIRRVCAATGFPLPGAG